MKKTRIIGLLLCAAILVCLSACSLGGGRLGGRAPEKQEAPAAEQELPAPAAAEEAPAVTEAPDDGPDISIPTIGAGTQAELETVPPAGEDGELTLTELYDIYTFTYNGRTYTLPFQAQELLDAGFVMRYNEPTDTLPGMSYDSSVPFAETKDSSDPNQHQTITADVYNPTAATITYGEGMVAKIHYSNTNPSLETLPFQTSRGIGFGATRSAVLAAYGEPHSEGGTNADGTISGSYQYQYVGSNKRLISQNGNGSDKLVFTFGADGAVNDIVMELVLFD